MKKFASIVIALAFVMGTIGSANAQDPNCVDFDVVGITVGGGGTPWNFSPDGQVTYGMQNWWEDDVYACYKTYQNQAYLPYFPGCDFNGQNGVEWAEVIAIYSFVTQHPTGGTPAYAYQCETGGGWEGCPADVPAYYDPAPGAHDVDSAEWAANGACNEFYTENGSGQSVCTQAQTNNFLADINGILADYDFTNAVFDGYNGGYQTYGTSTSSILCGVPGVMLPISFFDEIDTCWHGGPTLDGSMVMRFDWHVNYDAALDSYLGYIQETYPDAFCETSGLSGAPTGFHAADAGSGWKLWTVRSTANCDYYGCRCEATVEVYSDGAGSYFENSITNNSNFSIYQGMACEDARFNF